MADLATTPPCLAQQSFLDLIETALDRAGYRFLRFDGSMNVKEKEKVVEEFKQPHKGPLILRASPPPPSCP